MQVKIESIKEEGPDGMREIAASAVYLESREHSITFRLTKSVAEMFKVGREYYVDFTDVVTERVYQEDIAPVELRFRGQPLTIIVR